MDQHDADDERDAGGEEDEHARPVGRGAHVAIHGAYYTAPDLTRGARHRQQLERVDFTHAGRSYACRVVAGHWEYEVEHMAPDVDPAEGGAGGGGWYRWRERWPDDTPEEVAAGVVYHDRLRRDLGARAHALAEGHQVGDSRIYTDPQGTGWHVYEWEVGDEWPERRGQRCLVFEAAQVTWRLWEYPRNWRDLSTARLQSLGWRSGAGGGDAPPPGAGPQKR